MLKDLILSDSPRDFAINFFSLVMAALNEKKLIGVHTYGFRRESGAEIGASPEPALSLNCFFDLLAKIAIW